MLVKKTGLSILATIFLSIGIFAQTGGNYGYDFLEQPVSSRLAALGTNMASIDDNDLNIGFVNPSLINPEMNNKLALNYVNYFTEANFSSIQYANSFNKIGSFMASLQYMDYGSMDYADENGNLAGIFNAYDMALNIGWGRRLDSLFSVGATAKIIYSSYESYNSFGMAVDVAGTYHARSGLTMSLVASNIGMQFTQYVPGGDRDPLPFNLQYAISKRLDHVPFRFTVVYNHIEKWDLSYDDPNNPSNGYDPQTGEPQDKEGFAKVADNFMRHIVLGGELYIGKNLILRAGYNYRRRQEMKVDDKSAMVGFSWGFGVRIYKFHINYSRATYNLTGSPNFLTLAFDIDSFRK